MFTPPKKPDLILMLLQPGHHLRIRSTKFPRRRMDRSVASGTGKDKGTLNRAHAYQTPVASKKKMPDGYFWNFRNHLAELSLQATFCRFITHYCMNANNCERQRTSADAQVMRKSELNRINYVHTPKMTVGYCTYHRLLQQLQPSHQTNSERRRYAIDERRHIRHSPSTKEVVC